MTDSEMSVRTELAEAQREIRQLKVQIGRFTDIKSKIYQLEKKDKSQDEELSGVVKGVASLRQASTPSPSPIVGLVWLVGVIIYLGYGSELLSEAGDSALPIGLGAGFGSLFMFAAAYAFTDAAFKVLAEILTVCLVLLNSIIMINIMKDFDSIKIIFAAMLDMSLDDVTLAAVILTALSLFVLNVVTMAVILYPTTKLANIDPLG